MSAGMETGIVIRDGRFAPAADDAFVAIEAAEEAASIGNRAIEVANTFSADALKAHMDMIPAIAIRFPAFNDGRGFSLARQLRRLGYKGSLRARGHVLADQYPLALRCGFDEVEITRAQAERQPESQWVDAYQRIRHNYQDRLKYGAA
ncbi:MAG: DUF934 domain-containing protein [Flavobacteriaceae bacterium]